MRRKSILYKIMKEGKPPTFAYHFQALVFKEMAIPAFLDNCSNLVSSVVRTGSTVTVTDSTVRRRQQLGLPPIPSFKQVDIEKIAKATGIRKRLKEERQ